MMGKLAVTGGKKAVSKEIEKDPVYGEMVNEEVESLSRLIKARKISKSNTVLDFEKEWADHLGVKYSLAQCNGTSTLHAAYFGVVKETGDEIIAPVHTHLSAASIITAGGIPVFCDIDPLTLNIDPELIEEKITGRTRAISVTHCYGHPADMDRIKDVAGKHNLAVIEDCSHAHGTEYKGKKVGSVGDIGCFSLQGQKLMTGGEAGILSTGSLEYYERAIFLGHFERVNSLSLPEYRPYAGREDTPVMNVSFKYRAHPLAIEMARVEKKYMEHRNSLQMKNCNYISKGLEKIEGFDGPFIAPYATKVAWLEYLVRFYPEDFRGISRKRVIEALQAEGVEASPGRAGYLPLVRQPLLHAKVPSPCSPLWDHYLKESGRFSNWTFPAADRSLDERIGINNFRDRLFDEEYLQQVIEAFRKISIYRKELM